MKLSDRPTEYFLIRALNSCELCDFAIINTTEQWREIQKQRIEAVKPFEKDTSFKWLNYQDIAVDFYLFSDNDFPEIQKTLQERSMFFIELSKNEIEKFTPIAFSMQSYYLQIFSNGNAVYSAFEKYLGDEFWTLQFPLKELIK